MRETIKSLRSELNAALARVNEGDVQLDALRKKYDDVVAANVRLKLDLEASTRKVAQ